ncbi:thioester-containing protein 1 allele S3-like isoform X1 [Uranotaenia lowii]|uniref:thioester-containing protein 1 allele S3-like isoform X1 n=1 Tax=Uranotaenia lowii TaxID=190385 RepID=UPI00247909AC|nr:thioester-containing protein 1 allele S3-like isoform X1 [Uranotaenia lowii]
MKREACLHAVLLLLSVKSIAGLNHGNCVVMAPQYVTKGQKFEFAVASFDSNETTEAYVEFHGFQDDGREVTFGKQLSLGPEGSSGAFQIGVLDFGQSSSITSGEYNLKVQFTSGVEASFDVPLSYVNKNYIVLIQTDKPIYKPGNTVRFRVIVLDESTRPLPDLKSIHVTLSDPDENVVKTWPTGRLKNGIFQTQLDISNAPNLGNWTISAKIRDDEHSVQFPVDEYRLPQHEVRIRTPKTYTVQDKELTVDIDAYYGFGRIVKGSINVTAVGLQTLSKTFNFDGRLRVKFNMGDLLNVAELDEEFTEVPIMVTIQEGHSRNKITAENFIPVFKHRYQIHLEKSSKYFIPGQPYKCWVQFKDHLGDKLPTPTDEVEITISYSGAKKFEKTTVLQVDPAGDGSIPLSLSIPKEASSAKLTVKFQEDSKSFDLSKDRSKGNASLQLSQITKKVMLDQLVSFQVQSTVPLTKLAYHVSSGNKFLEMEMINVNGNSPVFSVKVTSEMFPTVKVTVFTIHNGYLLSDDLVMDVPFFRNSIELSTVTDEFTPGEKVRFLAETQPNSSVGLLAIDRSVLLLGLDGNQLTQSVVLKALKSATRSEEDSQILFLSNAATMPAVTSRFNQDSDEEDAYIKPRRNFPETWLWDDLHNSGSTGVLKINSNAPDSITTWEVSAFSISPQYGLGILEQPLSLKIIKSGFLKINLPNLIKKSEIAVVEVSIFNNRDDVQYVGVTLKNTKHEFELTDNRGRLDASYQAKNAVIDPYSAATVNFMIRPKKLGDIEVKVIAEGTELRDSVIRKLRVTTESLHYQKDIKRFIQLDSGRQEFRDFNLNIPRHIDTDSEEITFTILGDIIGNSVNDIQDSIRLPHGNAEQNALHMIPSLVLLEHNGVTFTYKARVTDRAILFLEKGYQNLLKFKRIDGSFSLFGNEDNTGSIYVTALVARTLRRASNFVTVDNRVIDQAFKWLGKQQNSEGSFTELSKDQKYSLEEAHRDKATLTAFTLLAFLEDRELIDNYRKLLDSGCKYLLSNHQQFSNLYTLSMTAFALQIFNHTSRQPVLDKFIEVSSSDRARQMRWWDAGPLSIEATGFGLLLFLAINLPFETKYIVNWIIAKQRNDFFNTQTTFTALEGLALYAHTFSTTRNHYDVSIAYGKQKHTIRIDAESSLTEQKLTLPPSTRSVQVSANGTGFGMFRIDYSYSSNILNMHPRFDLKVDTLNTSTEFYLDLSICTKFLPRESYEEPWFVLMEITFPSGYIALDESVEELEALDFVKKLQLKYGETTLLLYFDTIPVYYQCIKVTGFQQSTVLQQISGTVRVYDAYDNSRVAIRYFDGKQPSVCEVCENDCPAECDQ